jgi:PhoH-like ATPase
MKVKVLDTNVFLDRQVEGIFSSFEEPTEVVIPHVVLKELDTFKKGFEIKNENARYVHRFLNKLRKQGILSEGVPYEEHVVRVDIKIHELDLNKPDYAIIKAAHDNKAVLISQDMNELVIADALGIEADSYEPENVDVNSLYTGYVTIDLDEDEILEWSLGEYGYKSIINTRHELLNNQFVVMNAGGAELEGIYKEGERRIKQLKEYYRAFGELKPRNREQRFLLHALLDPQIECVTAIGPSGCGKTVLAFAAALEQTLNDDKYNRVMAMRPLVAVGDDIGFLPGDKLEKLEPWMASTFDALEFLLDDYDDIKDFNGTEGNKAKIMSLITNGNLELEAMAHIRGRSLPGQFIIIDDAQNLTRQQAVTIATRVGEGSKLVLLGDLSEKQIDNHRLTPNSNGLAYVVDRFKGQDITAHMTLQTVVRSRLAQLGVELL